MAGSNSRVSRKLSGNPVRALIIERELSYPEIGREIGITSQAVCEIVHGRTTSATARYALAAALGKKVSDLWPEEARLPAA